MRKGATYRGARRAALSKNAAWKRLRAERKALGETRGQADKRRHLEELARRADHAARRDGIGK